MAYQSELEKLQRRYEEKPSQWFAALAEEHRRAGDVQLAIEILRQGLEKRSNYVSGHIVLGRCLLDLGEEEEAQQVLERVLELDAENVIALKVLGEIAERADDIAAARLWLERLLEVDPMNEEGRQRLEVLAAAGEAGEAGEADDAEVAEKKTDEAVDVVESVGDEGAGKAEKAEEVGESVDVVESIGAKEPAEAVEAVDVIETVEVGASLESTVQESAITDAVPDETPEPKPPVADEVEVIEDAVEQLEDEVAAASSAEVESPPTDESAAVITEVAVQKDASLEMKPDAADRPMPEGIVRAEVERPEPIELTGGPGMVEGSDQARELGEGSDASQEAPAPAARAEPIPVEDLAPEPPEAAVPAGAEDTPPTAQVTEGPQDAPVPDPEPMVTETMADVYVKQGLLNEALKVYRALLARRPADEDLQKRIADLESRAAPAAKAPEAPRYRASDTGGTSTRDFLGQILAAGAEEAAVAPPPAAAPEEPTPLETAFAAPEDASEIPGAPTQPAPDQASLAAVFGEAPPPPPPPPPSSPLPGAAGVGSAGGGEGGGGKGVSYDEFFGGDAKQAPPPEKKSPDPGDSPDAETDGFKDWLKGLKS